MRRLADKSFLILYGVVFVLFIEVTPAFIAGFFMAAALSSCASFVENRMAVGLLLGCFCAAALFWPEFLPFLPLVFYDVWMRRVYPVSILVFLDLVYGSNMGREELVFLLLGMGAAFLLERKSAVLEEKEEKLRQIRDDSAERNLLLKERNKELLEKQDYEIYTATLKERNRIAREIHDNVGHVLSRTILMTGALKAVNKDTAAKETLIQLEISLNQAMDSIRKSVHDIHDDSVDLQKASESLIREFQFCPVHLEYDMELEIPRRVKYCFLSILKEALVNVSKHSGAKEVQVLMREHPALYQLKIQDDGKGGTGQNTDGIGLANMRERVKALNGTIQITGSHGFGIFITVPKGDKYESSSNR